MYFARTIAAAAIFASVASSTGAEPAAEPDSDFIGTWKIEYTNNTNRTYQIDINGTVLFMEDNRTAQLARGASGGGLMLDFGDGKLERLRFEGGIVTVERFDPKSSFPNTPPVLRGFGARLGGRLPMLQVTPAAAPAVPDTQAVAATTPPPLPVPPAPTAPDPAATSAAVKQPPANLQIVEVRPVTRKKRGIESRELSISVRNNSPGPAVRATVRWGIVRTSFSASHSTTYGAEETVELKPLQLHVIQTAAVSAVFRRLGGHGVQVLVDGKVVAEQLSVDSPKPDFDKLMPVE